MNVTQKLSSALHGTRLPEPRSTIRTSPKPDPTTRGSTATTAFRPTGARATPIPHTPAIPAEAPDQSLLAGLKVAVGEAWSRRSCWVEQSKPLCPTCRSCTPDLEG